MPRHHVKVFLDSHRHCFFNPSLLPMSRAPHHWSCQFCGTSGSAESMSLHLCTCCPQPIVLVDMASPVDRKTRSLAGCAEQEAGLEPLPRAPLGTPVEATRRIKTWPLTHTASSPLVSFLLQPGSTLALVAGAGRRLHLLTLLHTSSPCT
ncbi:hypothetical protein BCV69DRAFT_7446 [Microstroma glucosiphilum]|uniref:Uncharacterized protein n=1 Tax=Pseudomicrostroma glucosiphilum TaxID=1684307 RepID=A0A316UEN9_9BASI|nr:hypothetical protein BCV69DRAFT_7446 [Pseudomicrostroma glucosiphilum]PWN23682.1 hypothetical protein BCV69DRAFT_7446 [Pseudomicrostroma glucosiphilum]